MPTKLPLSLRQNNHSLVWDFGYPHIPRSTNSKHSSERLNVSETRGKTWPRNIKTNDAEQSQRWKGTKSKLRVIRKRRVISLPPKQWLCGATGATGKLSSQILQRVPLTSPVWYLNRQDNRQQPLLALRRLSRERQSGLVPAYLLAQVQCGCQDNKQPPLAPSSLSKERQSSLPPISQLSQA